MNKFLLMILMIPFFGQAQYFSGEITYKMKIIPKSDTIDIDEIIRIKKGNTMSYIITEKRYKSTYYKDGQYNYSYTYDDQTKRMYDDYADQSYITYRDSRRSNVQHNSSEILKHSTATILGHDCYMVSSESDHGTTKTFYSNDIKVNYTDFEGHKVGNWYDELKEVDGSLTLKSVTEYDTYFQIQEAVNIRTRKVKAKEFGLPDKPIAASFSALDNQVEMKQPTKEQIECYQEKVRAVSRAEGKKFTCYISFLLQVDGKIRFVEPHEEDEDGFHMVAVDVIQNCGFQFTPGTIEGQPVDSQVYFPVEFLK